MDATSDNGASLASTPSDLAFALAYQHLTGRSPQSGEWFAAFARRVWDAATERATKVAEDYATGAGWVNDAEGRPLHACPRCDGETVGDEIADLIRGGSRRDVR